VPLRPTLLSLVLLAILVHPTPASAQVKASEPASVSQTIDGTKLALEYSRPRARGRDSLFGKVVHWGEVWTPGANWATTIETSKDVRVNGHPLPKGKYSIWMIVRPGDWTVVFDTLHHRFHYPYPDSMPSPGQVRFDITPGQATFTEVLTWSFSEVRMSGTTLAMQWGNARVPLDIVVEQSYQVVVSPAKARPFPGKYTFAWSAPPPDSAAPPPESAPKDSVKIFQFTLDLRGDSLIGSWDPKPWPEADEVILIPIQDNWFITGFLEKGELWEIDKDFVFEFDVRQGRARSFEVRGDKDEVMATGTRQ